MKNNQQKNNIKVGLYNPFIDTLGGGEKHILSIIEVLISQGAEVSIFWNNNLSQQLKDRFALKYIEKIRWLPNIFNSKKSIFEKNQILKSFDYFFYVTDGSYFVSLAKKNYVFCMVPDKRIYNLNPINQLKLWNYKFISNSPFTTQFLKNYGLNNIITITPYIDEKIFSQPNQKKQKIILSVGRFFPHLHSKNQTKIIETFKILKSNYLFQDYKLVLVGGLKKEDQDYFNSLNKLAKNDSSIIFKPNLPLVKLYNFYNISNYFWHFTGVGVDEQNHPELVEHFGIAPLEAAASGCLTFCHNSGGPKEIFIEGETGFLFNNESELINKMIALENNPELQNKVKYKAPIIIHSRYSNKKFKETVIKDIINK